MRTAKATSGASGGVMGLASMVGLLFLFWVYPSRVHKGTLMIVHYDGPKGIESSNKTFQKLWEIVRLVTNASI